jgi:hypothetical protein
VLKIRRLNMDTSWEVRWDGRSVVIDPWLVGSEVDYFKWFNEQWHTTPPVAPKDLDRPDFILISQSYSDHTHEETIRQFDSDIPILASPRAYKRLARSFSGDRLVKLPLLGEAPMLEFRDFRIASLDPGRKLDPVYYAHLLVRNGKAIFYSSHGFTLTGRQLELTREYEVEYLLTSFSEIRLPALLGGRVNPGMENVHYLVDALSPRYVLNTHDEQKRSGGLVMKLANCTYPDLDKLSLERTQFIHCPDYRFIGS